MPQTFRISIASISRAHEIALGTSTIESIGPCGVRWYPSGVYHIRTRGRGGKTPSPHTPAPTKNRSADPTVGNEKQMAKILLVFTSAATTHTGKAAGYYLPEAAHVGVLGHILYTLEPDDRFTVI